MDIETRIVNGGSSDRPFLDWQVSNGSLASDNELKSNVLLALFTDRRANADDVGIRNPQELRGCWIDALDAPTTSGAAKRKIGSRLWQLAQSKTTSDVPARAKEYSVEALQHLIDDGVCDRIDITVNAVQKFGKHMLVLRVVLVKPMGQAHQFDFVYAWQQNTLEQTNYTYLTNY